MNYAMATVSGVSAGLVVLGLLAGWPMMVYAGAVCAIPAVVVYWVRRRRQERLARTKATEKHGRMRRTLSAVGGVVVPHEVRWAFDAEGLSGVATAGDGLASMVGPAKRDYRRESFEEAAVRFGLRAADIARIAKSLRNRGRIFIGGLLCCAAIFVGAAVTMQWLWVLATLMAMWTFLLAAAQNLYRAKQCDLAMLISPGSYFRNHFLNDANPLKW